MLNFLKVLIIYVLFISFFILSIKKIANLLHKKTFFGSYISEKIMIFIVFVAVIIAIRVLIGLIPKSIYDALMSI